MSDTRYTAWKRRDQVPTCPVMAACDGATLVNGAREKGRCAKCAAALAKREKDTQPKKLRGFRPGRDVDPLEAE